MRKTKFVIDIRFSIRMVLALGILYSSVLSSAAALEGAGADSALFATPLAGNSIDVAASVEWVDGGEHALANPGALRQLLWTKNAAPSAGPLKFGASAQAGPRYLRIAFSSELPVGSVMVRGGGALSVLRSGAKYPGNIADDSQWISAQRTDGTGDAEVDAGSFGVWTLPPGTTTRALRFTHVASETDRDFAGVLGGAYVLTGRFASVAAQATVFTSANSEKAALLTDGKYNNWGTWDNGPAYHHAVTATSPEWIILEWPQAVTLSGLAALWAGFNAADTESFSGAAGAHVQDAAESDWHSVGREYALKSQYPRGLGVDWMDFGKPVTTRAIRLRMTAPTDESHHAHLKDKTHDGMRVWLGELMAMSPLGSDALKAPLNSEMKAAARPMSVAGANGITAHPPIPVNFILDAPGFVTLVIDDASGNRVRNLVSNQYFEAGKNTAWWDGSDDLERDQDSAAHGVYRIPTHAVAPGKYELHGLVHKAIDLRYEFSVYNAGHPAWETPDTKGGWLTNHAPPASALYVPADKAPGGKPMVYLGSYISEGGAGLAWVDLEGIKQGGRNWVGGAYTAAPYLARDDGPNASPAIYAYVCAAWEDAAHRDPKSPLGIIRVTGLTKRGDKAVSLYSLDPAGTLGYNPNGKARWGEQTGGMAVRNRIVVISLTLKNELLLIDGATGNVIGTAPVPSPRGLAFDSQGRLLVLSGTQLLRYAAGELTPARLAHPETVVSKGLEEPYGITVDSSKEIYISDRGSSHQVKVFSDAGELLRSIGHAGKPQAGPYDALHMNNPRGLAIDSNHHLWVAEDEFQPKRVSVWNLDGGFVKAFYGPAQYGGGGTIDPADKSRFYYDGMQFKLDWATGKDMLASVFYRNGNEDAVQPIDGTPETVINHGGHRYFTNCFTGSGTSGLNIAFLYLEVNGIAKPVGAVGKANDWDALKKPEFAPLWPKGVDRNNKSQENSVLFSWSDANGNGKIDADEVVMQKAAVGWVTVMPDLSMVEAFVDGKAVQYAPVSTTAQGIPVYDLGKGKVLSDAAQKPRADGDGQILITSNGLVMTTAPAPYVRESLGGMDGQGHTWSYPNLWPGLHPAHSAPVLNVPGELTGTTRLLGETVTPNSSAGPIFAINGNFGEIYLFSADGLFIAKLFQDVRTGKPWSMPVAQRNMLLNDVSLHDENFFPSITQTGDGKIYLVDGTRTSIVRIDGLESLKRIAAQPLEVTTEQLKSAQRSLQDQEAKRQQSKGVQALQVPIRKGGAPAVESMLAGGSGAKWATVDQRTNTVGWSHPADLVEASISVAGDRLYAVYHSSDAKLLVNSGTEENAPFKTGGALDLMIGADAKANAQREAPVAGDVRLLVYLVNGKPQAKLYRAVVPGTKSPVPFSSPSRTIMLDQVADVSGQLQFAADKGNYAFSIPLATLGLKPVSGEKIKADIGILRGTGVQTTQRVYWNNKATGITSDVPSEAELVPGLWGEWMFVDGP